MLRIHPTVLFNIVNGHVGVLLGRDHCVDNSFEVVYDHGIDLLFYQQRKTQYQAIMPQLYPLGLYYPETLALEISQQLQHLRANGLEVSVLIINDNQQFRCLVNGKVEDYVIDADDIETYALDSVATTQDRDLQDHQHTTLMAVNQLAAKVTNIIQFLDENEAVAHKIHINRTIGQLTKKLKVLRTKSSDKSIELMINEVILLIHKVTDITKLDEQVDSNIMSIIARNPRYAI